ncbi:LEAF RUST 10 DISEASE-RESISTANCE LOCUS RECEPTOR-LIKE PROTEIN KINASE-like 1.1 isoform X2 [Quercus lobata]|uniref:non-specific serine/threonine protein kinase n=1 Tax=Quercus lobata TaxID=97700 RepID=A0A7N2QXX2_QUELO|nr:LEAF RUST 10 DISEASE-RESISTANCE LOCUS RECEPTOR-LIKE PROTEIN KINASE-like 1.1 isoform X2 [Quercus lobata]
MASVFLCVFFLISHLVLLYSAEGEEIYPPGCPPFFCGKVGTIRFPFANDTSPECGLLILHDCGDPHQMKTPKIKLERNGTLLSYNVETISQANIIQFKDPQLQSVLDSNRCESLKNWTLPSPRSPFISFHLVSHNLTLFKCNRALNIPPPTGFNRTNCSNYDIYYSPPHYNLTLSPPKCPIIQLPWNWQYKGNDLFRLLSAEIFLEVRVTRGCRECHIKGGQCKTDNKGKSYCTKGTKGNSKRVLVIGFATGCSTLIIFLVVGVAIWVVYKKKHPSQKFLSKTTYSDRSSRSDLEGGSVYFGIPVFSYTELEEATNNFDIEKELGDGGFGTVYHGKLRDGREVAVKRLYEHNYRRVEQFLNEVKILTRLHHKNLVSLYGCTSRHSRELLLVYEFVPKGTVADHIHGDRATSGSLKWATRLSIAIETASALAYLHASDIIHRDVKTNNILLDDNFCVKVADFGLSRLFPNDVTHVSTAPQGTPGYVDPEYHQCYQLTSKSDVYSFGVVLIELISSLPAVDMARHRPEINLANLAINKIEKCAFHELIDPHLGFESDNEVKRMAMSVAELAFQCIQEDKEMRPSMDEVLEALKKIQSGNNDPEEKAYDDAGILNVQQTASPDCDEVGLLKTKQLPPPSPNDVTGNWTSRSTTPNVSG